MTSRIQEQRFGVTATKPSNGARPSGELWLNLPDLRIGLIDPANNAVDLLGVRQYAATSSYLAGDYVVHAGSLLKAKTNLSPHAFTSTDWEGLLTQAQTDLLYTTQAQNDARYYTKTYIDSTYYTQTYINTNFYTRSQADANFYSKTQADARYLQLTGGVLSGALTIGGAGAYYTQAGGYMHGMAFGWDGAEVLGWVDGSYIGALATQAFVNTVAARYLPLTGGTLTGALQVNNNTTVLGTLQNSNGRLITYAPNYAPTITMWQGDVGAYGFWYDGNINYGQMGGDGSALVYRGRFRADGSIEATNRTIAAQGAFANSSQDFGMYAFSQYRAVQFAGNWAWLWDTTNGNLVYWTPAGFPFSIDGNGNVSGHNATFSGAISGDSLTANYIRSWGAVDCDHVWANDYAHAQVLKGGYNDSGTLQLWGSGDRICFRAAVTPGAGWGLYYRIDEAFDYPLVRGATDIIYIELAGGYGTPTGVAFIVHTGDGTLYFASIDGIVSDERIKENIAPTKVDALAVLQDIPVTEFDVKGEVAAWFRTIGKELPDRQAAMQDAEPIHVPIGFVAQHIQAYIPEVVTVMQGQEVEGSPLPSDTQMLELQNFVPYLVRAVQQLAARVEALEALT